MLRITLIVVALSLAGCAAPSAELVIAGKVYPMDTIADCERVQAKIARGACYPR